MTKTGKISAILIAICFVVLYVRRRSDLDGSAMVTLRLSVAYLATVALYVVNAIKGRNSWITTLFWIYASAVFYTAAIFFILGTESFERISEIVAFIMLLISGVLLWLRSRKKSDKAKYTRMLWDFAPIFTGVLWLGLTQ